MIVFLWAINGHLLRNPTLVWWSNDLLINHTESTIEVCLTVWNWRIRVGDGARVVPSRSCEFRAFWKRSVDCFKVLLVWPREVRVTSVTGVINWMRDGRNTPMTVVTLTLPVTVVTRLWRSSHSQSQNFGVPVLWLRKGCVHANSA